MPISFKEDHISQIPALLMLEKLGYTYLTPDEALALRGGNLANVLLEPVLRKQLAAINVVQVSSVRTTVFSEQNITAGIDALRNIPMDATQKDLFRFFKRYGRLVYVKLCQDK